MQPDTLYIYLLNIPLQHLWPRFLYTYICNYVCIPVWYSGGTVGGTYVHMYLRDYCQSLHFPCGNVCMMLCAVFCTSSVVTMATNCQKAEFRKKLNMYHLAPRIMTCLMDAPRTAVSGNVGTCLTHTHAHADRQTDRQTHTHTHTHTHTQPLSYPCTPAPPSQHLLTDVHANTRLGSTLLWQEMLQWGERMTYVGVYVRKWWYRHVLSLMAVFSSDG